MTQPTHIEVRGDRVHNLRNIDVDIPLGKLVAIAGVSGSGKSSLALGTLYAEGSRRYLEALSTYTRRRITQAGRADVDSVKYVPAALALHQRPSVPGVRSTFGTSSELLNSLRLMFSRLGRHRCPNGHLCPPSIDEALDQEITCPTCGVKFHGPSAEQFAFNSDGACPTCEGTGVARTVDESTLVPNSNLTIDQGAVVVWGSLIWTIMRDVARAMGVRTDVPFKDLTDEEKEIVYHGPMEKRHIHYFNRQQQREGEIDFTYYNAVNTVKNALAKVKDERGMKRVAKYLKVDVCPDCGGSRLSELARSSRIGDKNLAEATAMTLDDLMEWVKAVPTTLPAEMRSMADSIIRAFNDNAHRLRELGLGYLGLDRASSTLSTGERQRVQLARAVRGETTGVLYVLDEPIIGLHPSNIDGLMNSVRGIIASGNSVVLVDHDARVINQADYIIEMGPRAGTDGGTVIATGTPAEVAVNPTSVIGGYLDGRIDTVTRQRATRDAMFEKGAIHLEINPLHTVKALSVDIPRGRMTTVTGVSGSGKTTLILECLIPALDATINGQTLPKSVKSVKAEGVSRVNLIDSTPVGANVRSTVATYAGTMDDLRRSFAMTSKAKELGLKIGDFSYNTGSLRCPKCDGTGQIALDVQFLPDVTIECPDCGGSRYSEAADAIKYHDKSIAELMALSVTEARDILTGEREAERLSTLIDLGLGYLTLGEDTPALSGGEAQRLKLASEMGRQQADAVFVFDEPSIGLHPLDVQVLLGVFNRLVEHGATVIVIEHDLDIIKNSDYIIDMGPGGGVEGGQIVVAGTPEEVARCDASVTGKYL